MRGARWTRDVGGWVGIVVRKGLGGVWRPPGTRGGVVVETLGAGKQRSSVGRMGRQVRS